MTFRDRTDAGAALGAAVRERLDSSADVVVLGLARGGVPVAAQVAQVLGAPLDVVVVRKLGVPGQPELAMGAIATGGVRVLNPAVLRNLGVDEDAVERVVHREREELLRREQAYRGGRPALALEGRVVVLVDDGLATGATMLAAVEAVRAAAPTRVVVAVPVGAAESCARVAEVADDVVCVDVPARFRAVGTYYLDFRQTTDDEVRRLLQSG